MSNRSEDKKPDAAGRASDRKKKPLVEQAYERVKEMIITLHFLPGQYLVESAICAQLDMGRTPVHQALQRLHHEGLVEVMPRKGVIVQPDSRVEIIKILDSRLTVEPELARGAARRMVAGEITEKELAELQAVATATDATRTPPDLAGFTANDRSFHRLVATLSGNQVMSDFARMLHERSTRFWYLNLWQTIDVHATNEQHSEIAKAISAGDERAAGDAMYFHIHALRERLEKLQQATPAALRGL